MVTLLIRKLKLQRVLVFTHSTESVHRFKIETLKFSDWIKHWPPHQIIDVFHLVSGLPCCSLILAMPPVNCTAWSKREERLVFRRKHLSYVAILQLVNTFSARCWTNLRLVIFSWLFAAMHLPEELMSTISMEWSPMMLPLIWKRETRKSDLYWVTFFPRYVHRVGRTARAGKVGTAVTLSEEKQV